MVIPYVTPCSRRDQTSVQCASPKRRVPPRPRPRRRQRSHWIWTVPRDSWNNWCRFGVETMGNSMENSGENLKKCHDFSRGGLNPWKCCRLFGKPGEPSSMAYEYDGTRDVDAFDAMFSKLKYEIWFHDLYLLQIYGQEETEATERGLLQNSEWMPDGVSALPPQRASQIWQETHQALVRDGIINGESGNVPSATRLLTLGVSGLLKGALKSRRSGNVPKNGTPFFGTTGPTCSLVCC